MTQNDNEIVDLTATPAGSAVESAGRLVVAVDGPSGSGKSSVSQEAARRLRAAYLDTGAMYRAATWHCLSSGVDLNDAAAVTEAVQSMDLRQSLDPDVERVVVGDTDVTEAIRTPEVTAVVSVVANVIPVRRILQARQREVIEKAGRIVAEGRDLTTVVAPGADARILLTASEEVRMARRSGQLTAAKTGVDADTLKEQIAGRDRSDAQHSSFEEAADGVLLVDSSDLDFDQTVTAVLAAVEQQAGGSAAEGTR